MKSWRIITVLLLGLVLASTTACNPFADSEPEARWQLDKVVRGDLTVMISGSGNIEVSDEARLAFGVGGRIDKIYVKETDQVSKGEVLTRLDTISLEQAAKTAELAVKTAEVDLELATNDFRKIAYPYTYHTWVFDVPASIAAIGDAQRQLTEAQEVLEIGLSFDQYWEMWHALNEAQDNLVKARANLARGWGADVFASGIIPIRDYWTLRAAQLKMEKAQLAKEKAQSALDEANNELEKAIILAPFDGIVASVDADEGDTVSTTTTIIHLIDLTSMELKVTVWERDIPMIRLNQRAIIEVDALPDVQLKGWVTFISPLPTVEVGVILYEVKIGFDIPQDLVLKVGMNAEADIIIDERSNVLLVPNRAIKQDSQGNPIVEVMVNEQIQERPVVTGISDGFETEIVDGLSEGEIVVIER